MVLHDAIGLDPDSCTCVATLVRRNGTKPVVLRFPLTLYGEKELVKFIGKVPGVLVGIEGCQGQSSPLEKLFEAQGLRYFSVPALNIGNYRKAMVGGNKNNGNDARAVAEFLLDLEAKGQLNRFKEPEKVDWELRVLARRRLSQAQQITAEGNQLWKFLKAHANGLYLALGGHGENSSAKTKLTSRRVLNLFLNAPELGSWKHLSDEQICDLSGVKKGPGRDTFVHMIQSVSQGLDPIGSSSELILRQTAETLLKALEHQKQLEAAIHQAVEGRPLVQALTDHYKGMGAYTAALMLEEMITIDRFPSDDHLASYAGLTKRDHSTGTNTRQIHPGSCNTRLKSAFISFARSFLLYNTDSHLEKYHKHLIKKGMHRMEALKRIARALARDVYRFLKTKQVPAEKQNGEAVAMVTDSQPAPWSTSNTALPSPTLVQLTPPVNTEVPP